MSKKKWIIIAVIVICIISVPYSMLVDDEEAQESTAEVAQTEAETEESIQGDTGVGVKKDDKYGEIEDFKYGIKGKKIYLGSYRGKGKIVELKTSYTVDGVKYKTDISDFIVRKDIETLIIDEGFAEVNKAIFNSSGIQNVFFPKSMKLVYDDTLAYLHPNEENGRIKIYYAGTKKEWGKIFKEYRRTNVGDAIDQKDPEEVGVAIADKANEMLGMEYDSSQYEYFFSAKPDDLKK